MNIGAAAFDLDGVIVRTNFVKHDAMLSLFADYPDRKSAASDYILANGGVPRKTKLTALLRDYFDVRPTEEVLTELMQRYALALERQLAIAPMVPGVHDFITSLSVPRYICSSAPEAEVREQLARRSLLKCLSGVYGGQTPKAAALRAIAEEHPGRSLVFFGDSRGDYDAAQAAAVAFVGVVSERDNFVGLPVVKLEDFAHTGAVVQAMHLAVSHSAA